MLYEIGCFTLFEIARNKIVEENYKRLENICKGIASEEKQDYQDLRGPASEALIAAATVIVRNEVKIRNQQAYISTSIRRAIRLYLKTEKKQGFTYTKSVPFTQSLEQPLSEDGKNTVENTIRDKKDFEQDFLLQDQIAKKLPAGYHKIMKMKVCNPFASSAEIANALNLEEDAVESVIRRAKDYWRK